MTLAKNIALSLKTYPNLDRKEVHEIVSRKLSFVRLKGSENLYPSQISAGMQKRTALARAIAFDPEVLFFNEPSAGLDSISAKQLDDLILELKEGLRITVVIVTHHLAKIFAIGTRAADLDVESKTIPAIASPKRAIGNLK
jgi:phospholipid/cholesterol/gamma-HCH transport system ATP-binding protein